MTSLLSFLCLSSTGQESPWGSFFQNAALGSFWAQQWNKKPLQEYLPKISLARCPRKLLAARTTAHKPCRAWRGKFSNALRKEALGSAPPAWVYSACLIAEILPLKAQVDHLSQNGNINLKWTLQTYPRFTPGFQADRKRGKRLYQIIYTDLRLIWKESKIPGHLLTWVPWNNQRTTLTWADWGLTDCALICSSPKTVNRKGAIRNPY